MNLEYFLASLPILLVIVLLVLRVPSLIVVAVAIASVFVLSVQFPLQPSLVVSALPSTIELSITLALIMFSGIAIANFQLVSGAQAAINGWLNRLVANPERAVLFYGIAMVPLIESLVGWGLGVIIGIPMLLGAGLSKLKAIQIGLLGFMLCPWGSFSPSLIVVAELTGHSLKSVGTVTALYNAPIIIILAIAILLVMGGSGPKGKLWFEALAAATCMALALVATNYFIAPSLAGVVASLAASTVFILCARSERDGSHRPSQLVWRGLIPYALVLLGLTVSTGLSIIIGSSPITEVLTNPAAWLTLAVLIAPALMRIQIRACLRSLATSTRAWGSAFSVTLLFVLFGILLSLNGMGSTLAEGIALLGGAFAVLVPVSGFVAGFVTSSNTAAAAMFSEPLNAAAAGIGADPMQAVAVQTAASGAAVMCSPARVELARHTANLISPAHDEEVTVARIFTPVLLANGIIITVLAVLSFIFFA
ncbi:MAG: L-lactate permease [Leucobacter sp.]